MHELYLIEGTKNICERETKGREYNDPTFWPTFQQDYNRLKQIIQDAHKNKKSIVILRIFDGEFLFLQGKAEGNIPRRHCSKQLSNINIQTFKDGFLKADYVATQIYEDFLPKYYALFNRKIDFPMELIYALVANRWLFRTFKNKIGLIGSIKKLEIIKRLMQHKQYRDYLGIDYFTDYITVPDKFCCDDTEKLSKDIEEQLKNAKGEMFLFGIGISKLAIAYKFKEFKKAVYIDIGCGISALAGTTSIERPYFGGWTNFRLKEYNYEGMDQMDYKDTKNINEILL